MSLTFSAPVFLMFLGLVASYTPSPLCSLRSMRMHSQGQAAANFQPPSDITPPHPRQISLSPDVLHKFEEDGVVVLKGILADWTEFNRKMVEDQEVLYENPDLITDKAFKTQRWRLETFVHRPRSRYEHLGRELHRTSPAFQRMLTDSPVAGICAQVLGTDSLRITTGFIVDTPLAEGPGWHQDTIVMGPIKQEEGIRFWIPLDACGQDGTGVNPFLLGSHKNTEILPGQQAVPSDFPDKYQTLVPELEAGDVVIYSPRTIHKSPEPSTRRRRVFGGTFCRGDAMFDGGVANGCERFWKGARAHLGKPIDQSTAPQVYPRPPNGHHDVEWGTCMDMTVAGSLEALWKDSVKPKVWVARKAVSDTLHALSKLPMEATRNLQAGLHL